MPLATYASDGSAKVLLQPYVDSVTTPTLVYPTSDGMYVSALPDIDWTDTSATYDLIISVNSDLSAPIVNLNSITALAVSHYLTSGLVLNTTYYYRFRAHYRFGTSAWSTTRTFVYSDPLLTYISNLAGLVAYWPFDDTSGIVARVVNPAVAEGRNLVLNPTPTSATSWTLNAGWAYASSLFTHTAGTANTVTQALAGAVITGRIYKVVFTISGSTTGTVTSSLTAAGAAHTGNATFTDYILATGTTLAFTPSSVFDGSISAFSVTQVGIQSSSAFPTLELVKDPGFDYPLAAWPAATNWAQASSKATHTAGSTTILTQTLSITIGRTFDCIVVVSGRTAGTITPRAGSTGTGGSAISANGTAATQTLTCGGSAAFALVPSSDFDGAIESVSLVPTDGLVVWNGDGSTTTGWSAANSATLSIVAGWFRVAYNGVANAGAFQACLKIGSTYVMTIDLRSDGTAIPSVIAGTTIVTGTSSTSTQTLSATIVPTAVSLTIRNNTASGYIEWRNATFTEIAPMSGVISGATINQSANALMIKAYLLDGVNDYVNTHSGAFNSALNPASSFSLQIGFNWTSGASKTLLRFRVDANNYLEILVNSGGVLELTYAAGGTVKTVTGAAVVTGWSVATMVVNTAGGTLDGYLNGALAGTQQTSIGTWVGNFTTTEVIIGARGTAAAQPFNGYLTHIATVQAVLSAAVVLAVAQLSGVAS